MQTAEILSGAAAQWLQGSCWQAIDEASYQRQVRSLRRCTDDPDIPFDPYEIPGELAQRLLRYDRTVSLTADQHRTYRHAMRMGRELGPCCKRWRWTVFRGLSKRLIVQREVGAAELAKLIEALDGCGVSGEGHGDAGHRS